MTIATSDHQPLGRRAARLPDIEDASMDVETRFTAPDGPPIALQVAPATGAGTDKPDSYYIRLGRLVDELVSRERASASTPEPAWLADALMEPAATSATVPARAAADPDEIRARILALVAEKTGYPEDMLDVDLDLEADLGVDTVKQAELFAVVRESYGIERDDSVRLRDFPTLAHVIGFVVDRQSRAGATPAPPAPAPAPDTAAEPQPAVDREAIRAHVLELVAEKTGYPPDMLDLDLDLEADLGIDTVKQAELFAVIRESYAIERDETVRLRDLPTLGHVVGFVVDRARPGAVDAVASVAKV